MDEVTRATTRLGIEVVTAGFAGDGDATMMRDAMVRIVQAPNPLTEALPYVQDEQMRALGNAIHLAYGVANVAKRALEKLAEERGVTAFALLQEIAADLAQE